MALIFAFIVFAVVVFSFKRSHKRADSRVLCYFSDVFSKIEPQVIEENFKTIGFHFHGEEWILHDGPDWFPFNFIKGGSFFMLYRRGGFKERIEFYLPLKQPFFLQPITASQEAVREWDLYFQSLIKTKSF